MCTACYFLAKFKIHGSMTQPLTAILKYCDHYHDLCVGMVL